MFLVSFSLISIPWLEIYIISIIASFFLGKTGYAYLEQTGVLPKKFSGKRITSCIIISIIPVINIIWGLSMLKIGIASDRDPAQRVMIKEMFSMIEEQTSISLTQKINNLKNKNIVSKSESDSQKIEDLINRIEELESKIKELEEDK